MQIWVSEKPMQVDSGLSLFALRDRLKPHADVVVRNGAPAAADVELTDGDQVVFIRRGELPSRDELEALMVARHSPGVHEKVCDATVGIAGLGGLGSAVAVALARLGVGRLVLVDFDVVEPSNLNRQQYFIQQLGMAKTTAMTENLVRITPYVHVKTHNVRITRDNVAKLFADVDVLVEAFDTAEGKEMLLDAFHAARPQVPVVLASGLAGTGPGGELQVRRLGRNVYVVGDNVSEAGPGRGLMAPRVGIVAHLQANVVLRLLLGETEA